MAVPAAAKPPTGNRKTFRRAKISPVERVVSLTLVVLLAIIGSAIWFKGKHYDPDRFALNPDALKSTAAAVEGKSGTAHGTNIDRGKQRPPSKLKPTAKVKPPSNPPREPLPLPHRPPKASRWKLNSTG